MPLPRIWNALRWFDEHPPVSRVARWYLNIKDPEPRSRRPVQYSSEAEILGLGRMLGMGEG